MAIGEWLRTRLRVRQLAGVLRNSASTEEARREAADGLAAIGAPAVPALMACFDHPNEAVRDHAAAALTAVGEPAVRALLWPLCSQSEGADRAARCLTDIGAPAVQPLCAVLARQEGPLRTNLEVLLQPSLRSWAVTILGRIGDPSCLGALLDDATIPIHHGLGGEDRNEAARSAVPQAIENMAQRDRQGVISALEEVLATSSQAHVLEAAEEALRLLTACPITDGVRKLEEACLDEALLTATAIAMGDEAAAMIAAEGADGARALAVLLRELLACRSAKVLRALAAAERAEPVDELVSAVSSVASAPPTAPQPRRARFTPRLVGAGTVGWDDETAGRIRQYASQVLATLESRRTDEGE